MLRIRKSLNERGVVAAESAVIFGILLIAFGALDTIGRNLEGAFFLTGGVFQGECSPKEIENYNNNYDSGGGTGSNNPCV